MDDPSIRSRLEGHCVRTAVESGLTQTLRRVRAVEAAPAPAAGGTVDAARRRVRADRRQVRST